MTHEEMKLVAEAHELLLNHADDSCYCEEDEEDECTIENPNCKGRQAERSRWLLGRALKPPTDGLHVERLTNPPERIYWEEWQKECDYTCSQGTFLELLIHNPHNDGKYLKPVSHRDAAVATTVAQWLGTNCGRCFIERCERRIKEERAAYQFIVDDAWQHSVNKACVPLREDIPVLDEAAAMITGRFKSKAKPDYVPLEELLKTALHKAYQLGKKDANAKLAELIKET
jgi:hypothetical protein